MEKQTWKTFFLAELGVKFTYPETTSRGHLIEFDDLKIHVQSKGSRELYFEITRHLNVTAQEIYEREKEFVTRQLEAEVSELKDSTSASRVALEYNFTWTENKLEKKRNVFFIHKGEALYRIIYDPQTPLSLEVLETLELM
jgi:hypothetical protein